jgi:sulfane dehydrogenase subunit SoxC
MWRWDGKDALLASQCVDETGYEQPPLSDLIGVRGTNSAYHNNGIQVWKVMSDGTIKNGNS